MELGVRVDHLVDEVVKSIHSKGYQCTDKVVLCGAYCSKRIYMSKC
jgi:hypothetical protein